MTKKMSRLILSSLVRTPCASFNSRFESLRYVHDQFSTSLRQIRLSSRDHERKGARVENHQKLVSEFKREQSICRYAVPLNAEIIIVLIFICQFLAAFPCPRSLSFGRISEIRAEARIFQVDK